MKIAKILGILALVYVLIVVAFESLIGYYQPTDAGTLVITTTDDDGNRNDRVLSRIMVDDTLYVAANHWPRAWYRTVLANPQVEVELDGVRGPFVAVRASDAEHERIQTEQPLPFVVRVLTGFPPRYFVRLDPAPGVG